MAVYGTITYVMALFTKDATYSAVIDSSWVIFFYIKDGF
jgi:hypothetical protein